MSGSGGVVEGDGARGVTRREALKKGALFGGALVWTVPAVQVVGVGRAFAQTTSPLVTPPEPPPPPDDVPPPPPDDVPPPGDVTPPSPPEPPGVVTPPSPPGAVVTPPADVGPEVTVPGAPGAPPSPVAGPLAVAPQQISGAAPAAAAQEALPKTGLEVAALAGWAGGLTTAGIASLKAARALEDRQAGEPRRTSEPAELQEDGQPEE